MAEARSTHSTRSTGEPVIGNSIQEIATSADAPLTAGLLDKLKDIDAQRIARSDDLVIRKGVLALFTVVAELEARVRELEGARRA